MSEGAPRSRRPERPTDEYRLEEQPHRTGRRGVQTERVGALDELSDVSREDGHKEPGGNESDDHPIPRCEQQGSANGDLEDPRYHDDKIGIGRKPIGNLGQKLAPRPRQVTQAGDRQHRAEQESKRALGSADLGLLAGRKEPFDEANHRESLGSPLRREDRRLRREAATPRGTVFYGTTGPCSGPSTRPAFSRMPCPTTMRSRPRRLAS